MVLLDQEVYQGIVDVMVVGNYYNGTGRTDANVVGTTTVVGTESVTTIDFTIPRGDKGETGTIAVGSTTTGVWLVYRPVLHISTH